MIRVTAAVVERNGRFLVARRKPGLRFGGVWEFPGGKVEPGETAEECLRREIREELGLEIAVDGGCGVYPHSSSDLAVELIAFRATILSGHIVLRDHDAVRWAAPADLDVFDFSEPDRPLIRMLRGESRER